MFRDFEFIDLIERGNMKVLQEIFQLQLLVSRYCGNIPNGCKSSYPLANTFICLVNNISIYSGAFGSTYSRMNTVIFLGSVRLQQNHHRRILYKQSPYYPLSEMMTTMRWICIYCNNIMDCTNFKEFIKQSDGDKNSNQEAKVEYHSWRLLPED